MKRKSEIMAYDKDEMIDKLWEAKDIVADVFHATDVNEVGNVMCDIDEAIAVLEDM